MNHYTGLMYAFEEKLRKLMSAYLAQKEENKQLQEALLNERERLIRAHAELVELRKKNEHLTIAGSLSGSTEEKVQVKKQIDQMVREIDKCLALLDE